MSDAVPRRTLASVAIVGAAVLLLASLFIVLRPGGDRACPEPSVLLEAVLTPDGLQPAQLVACRDQQVELRLTSEVTGFLHLHGYDDHPDGPILADLQPGDEVSFDFAASRSGQFPIELHTQATDLTVGVLLVDEP
jgi:hypothetical protein